MIRKIKVYNAFIIPLIFLSCFLLLRERRNDNWVRPVSNIKVIDTSGTDKDKNQLQFYYDGPSAHTNTSKSG